MGTHAATYRRISDDREGEELGVTRQAEDLAELAERHGLTVVADYPDDDISASTRSRKPRPEYDQMIADAKAGRFKIILAYTQARLTRRPRENEDLIELAERYGVRFLYVRSPSFDLNTADGRHVARILAANDAATSERTGELVARKAKQRAERGESHGGARRYGYEIDGVTVVPAEAEIVCELTRRTVAGESTRSLADDLRRRGVPSGRGGAWSARVVKEIVCRPRNAGLRVANEGTENERTYPAAWAAIVDPDEWAAARAVLLDPSRGVWHGQTPASLLAGLATCGTPGCGRPVGSGAHGTYVGARGRDGSKCGHIKRRRHLADDVINRYVLGVLDREQIAVPKTVRPVTDHTAKIAAVRKQIEKLEDRLADDLLDEAAYRRQRQRKTAQLHALEAEQVRTVRPDVLAGVTPQTWSSLPLERRRAVVDRLCSVRLVPRGFDAENGVEITPKQRG